MSKKSITLIVAVVVAAGFFGFKAYADKQAEEKVRDSFDKMKEVMDVRYRDVSVDLLTRNVRIKGLSMTPKGEARSVTVEEVILYDADDKNAIPHFIHMAANGFEVPVADLGESAEPMKDMGYERIRATLEVDYAYDPEKKRLHLKKWIGGAEDVGVIEVAFRIGNFDMAAVKNPLAFLFSLPQMAIQDAKVTYQDDSLVDRVIARAAREQGMDAAAIKGRFNEQIDREIQRESDAFTREALTAIKGFVNAPEHIAIAAEPEQPVSLELLMNARDPKDVIRLLNVTVRH